ELGFLTPSDAIGKIVQHDSGNSRSDELIQNEYEIIGVIPDINFMGIKSEARGGIYSLQENNYFYLTIRYNGDDQQILSQISDLWKDIIPTFPLEYAFVSDLMSEQYAEEQKQMTMFAAFSGLAIFIACLGLFGLASFTAERRTKEIGIRKVFGAEVWQIVQMLVFQFSKPVLIANIIAWPIAYLAMSRWLESFVYRIDDMVIIALCLIAGLSALLIAWATVAGNSYAVARQNPIKALRYE
ncbi:MAG: ABC transporter permease, partial [Kordiimonadaceae bacterium]|nr:ABC transporter permease [Kordiimonadaceae bacterium]